MTENMLYPRNLLGKLDAYLSKQNNKEMDNAPKFVFLCGKNINIDDGGNRDIVRSFFHKNRKDVFCLFAEDLFTNKHKNEIDLLTYEHYLAELSDGIILFIESFGTACELGAFSMMDSLEKKLLVINDIKHKESGSFLNEGPIKKIQDELKENVIFTDTNALLSNYLIDKTLRNFVSTKRCIINRNADCVNLKSFIIEVLDLICLFGPITQKDLLYIYKRLKNFTDFFIFGDETNYKIKNIQIGYMFDLLEKCNLIFNNQGYYVVDATRYKFCSIMFRPAIKEHLNMIRSIALSRKFRYKEGIEACL